MSNPCPFHRHHLAYQHTTRPSPPDAINPAHTDAEKLALFNTRQACLLEEQRQALDEKKSEDLTAGAATYRALPQCYSPASEAPSTSSATSTTLFELLDRLGYDGNGAHPEGAAAGLLVGTVFEGDLIDRGPDPGVWCGWCGTSSSRYAVPRQRSFVVVYPAVGVDGCVQLIWVNCSMGV